MNSAPGASNVRAPRSAAAYSWLGLCLAFVERSAEAVALARRATELEPLSANAQTNVAWAFYAARRFEEAVAEFRRALHIDPLGSSDKWQRSLRAGVVVRVHQTFDKKVLSIALSRGESPTDLPVMADQYGRHPRGGCPGKR